MEVSKQSYAERSEAFHRAEGAAAVFGADFSTERCPQARRSRAEDTRVSKKVR